MWPKEKRPFRCLVFSPRQRCKEPCSLKYTWDTDELGRFFYFCHLSYSNLCLSWAPTLIHLFFNGIQFWIMGSILQTFTRQCFTSDRIVKVFLKLVTTHPTFILGWLWIGGWSALIKRYFSSFSGISDGLGKPSFFCDRTKCWKKSLPQSCVCHIVLVFFSPWGQNQREE